MGPAAPPSLSMLGWLHGACSITMPPGVALRSLSSIPHRAREQTVRVTPPNRTRCPLPHCRPPAWGTTVGRRMTSGTRSTPRRSRRSSATSRRCARGQNPEWRCERWSVWGQPEPPRWVKAMRGTCISSTMALSPGGVRLQACLATPLLAFDPRGRPRELLARTAPGSWLNAFCRRPTDGSLLMPSLMGCFHPCF